MADETALTALVEREVLSFDEVSRFAAASLTENITQAVLRRPSNPSISISTDDDGAVSINIEIIVYYGVNIPQLCYDIQTRVKKDIQEMTEFEIRAVNIRVEGIDKRETQSKE